MSNLIVCPKCNKVIAHNSYFKAYICSNCDYIKHDNEEGCNVERTTRLDDTFNKQEEISWVRNGVSKSISKINIGDAFVYIPIENSLVFRLIKKCEEIVKHENTEKIQRTYVIANLLTGELKEFTQQDFPASFIFPVKVLKGNKDDA